MALRFQGKNATKLPRSDIEIAENGWYKVQSQSVHGEHYSVNATIGFCTCPKGSDGSPCIHQAAVVVQFKEYGLNYVSSMSPSARQMLAKAALGENVITDIGFYFSLHQQSLQGKCRTSTGEERNEKFQFVMHSNQAIHCCGLMLVTPMKSQTHQYSRIL